MHQLIYVSEATDVFFLKDLETLLRQARVNNEKIGVTGLLLHTANIFLQVLEGEEKAVKELYAHIAKDRRHTQSRILVSGPIDTRSFPDWQMGFANPDSRQMAAKPGFSKFFDTDFNVANFGESPTQAKEILLAFREGDWRKTVKAS